MIKSNSSTPLRGSGLLAHGDKVARVFSSLCKYCHDVQHLKSGQNYNGVEYKQLTPNF